MFRTPEAQCLGTHTAQLSLIPYSGKPFRTEAAAEAYRQSVPFTVIPTGLKSGELPPTHSWLQWEGDGLLLTSVKVSEETGDLAVRWFNASMQPAVLLLDAPPGGGGVWNKSNIMEERLHRLTQGQDGRVRLPVRPAEIVTAVYERGGQEGLPLA